jgi:hypothetical protein
MKKIFCGKKLNYTYSNNQVVIDLPAALRSDLVDVVQVGF